METIFVVEPDKLLLQTYTQALEKPGRQVVPFRTANLAVRALEKVIPDIVVVELALPTHNGFELLYELRSYHDTRNVKVVVNSFIQESSLPWGFVNPEDLGIVAYLNKSFTSLDDLKKAVNGIK